MKLGICECNDPLLRLSPCPIQIDKDIQKAMSMMDEVSSEIERKKEASKKVKALKAEIQNSEAEAAQLMAHKQHLQRCIQIATERHERLEKQVESCG